MKRIFFHYSLLFLLSFIILLIASSTSVYSSELSDSSSSGFYTDSDFLFQAMSSSSSSSSSSGGMSSSSSGGMSSPSSSSSSSSSSSGSMISSSSGSSSSSSSSGSSISNLSSSSSSSSSSGGSIDGSSPSPSDTYIFTKGTLLGVQLYTNPFSSFVGTASNPYTNASGIVVQAMDPFNESICSEASFHGNLFNKRDPQPKKCGWGTIEQSSKLSKGIQNISLAITAGVLALKNIKLQERDLDRALTDINSSLDSLDDLRVNVFLDKKLKNKPTIKNNINCSTRRDRAAIDIIESLKKKVTTNDLRALSKALKDGVRCKRRVITVLFRSEKKKSKNKKTN